MARKSLTLVKVGPGVRRSPSLREESGRIVVGRETRPDRGRARGPVRGWCRPHRRRPGRPAEPAPPSVPSVSPASAAMPAAPSSASASASAYSWFGPPRPLPRIVTVSSPPDRITARRPCACSSQRERGVLGRDLARLALDSVAEQDAFVAGARAPRFGRARRRRPAAQRARTRCWRTADRRASGVSLAGSASARGDRLAAGRGDSARRSRGHPRASVGSGTVGPEPITAGSSPGTSEIASVTTRAGCARARQPSALDAREMLAHRVDLADRCAGAQAARASPPASRRARALRPARSSWPMRRRTSAPARDRPRRRCRRARASRSVAASPGRVGDRMAGLDHPDEPCRPRHSRAASPQARRCGLAARRSRRDSAARRPRPSSPRPCRRPGRSAGRRRAARQVRRQAVRRMRRRDRGVEQAVRGRRGRTASRRHSLSSGTWHTDPGEIILSRADLAPDDR